MKYKYYFKYYKVCRFVIFPDRKTIYTSQLILFHIHMYGNCISK